MHTHFFTKKYLVLGLAALLSGCGLTDQKPGSEPERNVSSSNAESVTPKSPSLAGQFLAKAEGYYQKGMLLSPASDNAYIRYSAVKILDPSSKQAQAGLDGILVHEIGLVKDLLAASKYSQAEARLVELEKLFPAASALVKLRADIGLAKAQQRKMALANSKRRAQLKSGPIHDDRIYLDASRLTRREPALLSELELLAKRVQSSEQSILIYARSDAEGRWIYQQMRKATPGYRIRGDIRIGKPAIKLLSPIKE